MLGTCGGGGLGTRRVPLPLRLGALLGASRLFLLFSVCIGLCHGTEDAEVKVGIKCLERERKALLAVRADIWGAADKWLSSWERDEDCCRWKGVGCDNQSGHVVRLDLRNPYPLKPKNQSKINPSLFNLMGLRFLDLSYNDFGGAHIPNFIGSLVNLESFHLSYAGFAGPVPAPLGSLRNLRFLDLSGLYNMEVGNLRWLPHLSHLQYLDMSGVSLSAVTDWLQVINMLPSLSVLRLSGCLLPNPSTTLPHVNFTSLSTLDLSTNWFSSTWPFWLFNLSNLVSLDLSYNFFPYGGPIPDGFGDMKHLEVLRLDYTDFEGVIPRSLWELENLEVLGLSGLSFGSTNSCGHLNNLQFLELDGVVGRLPECLGNVSSLLHLRLSNVIGELPESLGNLRNLKDLEMSFNNFSGGIPKSLGSLSHLQSLTLYENSIARVLLEPIGNLCNLTDLHLVDNKFGGGEEVTGIIGGLVQCPGDSVLENVVLSGNGHVGHLPEQVWQLRNLKTLDLSHNSFFGSIPASFGALTSLINLYLQDNGLSGPVPKTIGKISNLLVLDISGNSLVSVLSEAHFSNLSRLAEVDLSYNALSFNIHEDWIPPFQLSRFRMSSCKVGPEFPKWLRTQRHFLEVDLSNNVIHESPPNNLSTSFLPSSSLNLSHNQIKGMLPTSFMHAPFMVLDLSSNYFEASKLHLHLLFELSFLDLSNNEISGPVSIEVGETSLQYLDLINGSIPLSICEMKYLAVLDLSNNHLSGFIPQCWKSTHLIAVKLSNNMLSGHIPQTIGNLPQLESLHLSHNELSEEIPSSLKNCTQLVMLDLGENILSGEIPTWFGESLLLLEVLRLRSNMFSGNIPLSLSQLHSLRILDLASNKLSGALLLSFHNLSAMVKTKIVIHYPSAMPPTSIFALPPSVNFVHSPKNESIMIVPKGTKLEYTTTLSLVTIIDLSDNNFSGQIPEEITNLNGLYFLNLSWNYFEGKIPENISAMRQLESLDLSVNQLSGNIPSSISTLNFLSHLDVSYNNLSGRIPSGGQLGTFDKDAYIGNLGLCGPPLLRPCLDDVTPQEPTFQASKELKDKHESHVIWLYIGMAPGFVIGFWGFIGVLLLMGRNKRVAYFHFIDKVGDELYVMVVVNFTRLKLMISSWI